MGVFHVLLIVQMVPNRTKHHIYLLNRPSVQIFPWNAWGKVEIKRLNKEVVMWNCLETPFS